MKIFSFLLFSLTGLLSYFVSYFFLLLIIPVSFLAYYWTKEKKVILYGLLFTLISFLISNLNPKGSNEVKQITGIIVSKKDTYYLLLTLKGKYLVYDDSTTINLFNIVSLTGKSVPLSFKHFEQGFSFESYLNSQGVYHQFIKEESKIIFKFYSLSSRYQNWISLYLNDDAKEIVFSLLFAQSISSEKREILSLYSFSNLFSTSGMHISFVLGVINNLLKNKLKDKSEYIVLSVSGIFLIMSGFKFTLTRIFIYRIIRHINYKKKLKLNHIDILSITVLILVFPQPYIITSSSFYYSIPFLFFIRLFPIKEKGIKKYLLFLLQLTLFYLPYKLSTDYSISILGLIFQVVLSPVMILLFTLSLFLIVPQVGYLINFIIKILLSILRFGEGFNIVLVSGKFYFIILIIYYLILFFALTLKYYNYKFYFKVSSVALGLFTSTIFIPDYSNHYEVHFIDVDQGDCTLIRNKQNNLLIDTGGLVNTDLAKEGLIPYFNKLKIRKIDYVILTHLDYDHYGALESLEKNFNVTKILQVEDFISNDNTYYCDLLKIENLNFYDLNLTKDKNYHSGVYKFSIKEKDFLIMGDAPKEIEYKIIRDNPNLNIDYLKVGHHGSNTSSSEEFISHVKPKEAIISCGENNRYKFPHAEVINALNKYNVKIRRTDLEGTIIYKL